MEDTLPAAAVVPRMEHLISGGLDLAAFLLLLLLLLQIRILKMMMI